MKYLDDRITFHLDTQDIELPYVPIDGANKFEVYRYNAFNSSSGYKQLVFVGHLYHDSGTSQDIDITDIVRSLKEVPNSESLKRNSDNWSTSITLQDRFKVIWYCQYYNAIVDSVESDWLTVSMIYRYPNYTNNFNDGSRTFVDTFTIGGTKRTALQGFEVYALPPSYIMRYRYLMPAHYPLKSTNTCKFIQSFIASTGTTSLSINVMGSDSGHYYHTINFTNSPYKKGSMYVTSISDLVGSGNTIAEISEDLDIYDPSNNLIGKLDNCYKRYYLMWQDRFGGFQSQAFNDYAEYSETFNTTETQNYRNERKKSFIQIQPKFKIYSDWIPENLYPLYESLYISPILYLYDSQEDRIYDVIVNSNYIEKKYKNEKKLININLELELATKQNIIY